MDEKTDFGFKKIDLIVLPEVHLEYILKLIISNKLEDLELAEKKFNEIID